MGSQNWWFGDPRTLLYTSKPVYRRVQWFLGQIKTLDIDQNPKHKSLLWVSWVATFTHDLYHLKVLNLFWNAFLGDITPPHQKTISKRLPKMILIYIICQIHFYYISMIYVWSFFLCGQFQDLGIDFPSRTSTTPWLGVIRHRDGQRSLSAFRYLGCFSQWSFLVPLIGGR